MSLRWMLRNLSSKARFLSTTSYSSRSWCSNLSTSTPLMRHSLPLFNVLSRSETCLRGSILHGAMYQILHERSSIAEVSQEELDPFSLVADELSVLANRLQALVAAEFPKLGSAAEYFFKMGIDGKRFRPTVLLLMASALNFDTPKSVPDGVTESFPYELRMRHQRIAEITEMIHVASLLHDNILDDAETRLDNGSLNYVMGSKLAVLAGDFLLSRAYVAVAALNDTELELEGIW